MPTELILSGQNGTLTTSQDGISWTSRTSGTSDYLYAATWSPDLELFVVVGNNATIITSPDGINWTSQTSPTTVSLRCGTWSPDLELFVVAGTNGDLITSPDGINWTSRTTPTNGHFYAATWSPDLELFVVVGTSGGFDTVYLITSPDGINWTSRTTPTSQHLNAATWSPDLELFVVAGRSGTLITSPDGINWTSRTTPTTEHLYAATWSPDLELFVVGGTNGDLITSPDGINWTSQTSPTTEHLLGGTWSPDLELFVLPGASGDLITSPDGINWTSRTSGTSDTLRGTVSVSGSLTAGPPQEDIYIEIDSPASINIAGHDAEVEIAQEIVVDSHVVATLQAFDPEMLTEINVNIVVEEPGSVAFEGLTFYSESDYSIYVRDSHVLRRLGDGPSWTKAGSLSASPSSSPYWPVAVTSDKVDNHTYIWWESTNESIVRKYDEQGQLIVGDGWPLSLSRPGLRDTDILTSGGFLYLGDNDGNFYGVDNRGAKLWETSFANAIRSITKFEDHLFVAVGSSAYFLEVHKIRAADGVEVTEDNWPYSRSNRVDTIDRDDDGNIYIGIGGSSAGLVKLSPEGSVVWARTNLTGAGTYGVGVDNILGVVYAGTTGPNVHQLKLEDGTENWRQSTPKTLRRLHLSPVGEVYVSTADGVFVVEQGSVTDLNRPGHILHLGRLGDGGVRLQAPSSVSLVALPPEIETNAQNAIVYADQAEPIRDYKLHFGNTLEDPYKVLLDFSSTTQAMLPGSDAYAIWDAHASEPETQAWLDWYNTGVGDEPSPGPFAQTTTAFEESDSKLEETHRQTRTLRMEPIEFERHPDDEYLTPSNSEESDLWHLQSRSPYLWFFVYSSFGYGAVRRSGSWIKFDALPDREQEWAENPEFSSINIHWAIAKHSNTMEDDSVVLQYRLRHGRHGAWLTDRRSVATTIPESNSVIREYSFNVPIDIDDVYDNIWVEIVNVRNVRIHEVRLEIEKEYTPTAPALGGGALYLHGAKTGRVLGEWDQISEGQPPHISFWCKPKKGQTFGPEDVHDDRFIVGVGRTRIFHTTEDDPRLLIGIARGPNIPSSRSPANLSGLNWAILNADRLSWDEWNHVEVYYSDTNAITVSINGASHTAEWIHDRHGGAAFDIVDKVYIGWDPAFEQTSEYWTGSSTTTQHTRTEEGVIQENGPVEQYNPRILSFRGWLKHVYVARDEDIASVSAEEVRRRYAEGSTLKPAPTWRFDVYRPRAQVAPFIWLKDRFNRSNTTNSWGQPVLTEAEGRKVPEATYGWTHLRSDSAQYHRILSERGQISVIREVTTAKSAIARARTMWITDFEASFEVDIPEGPHYQHNPGLTTEYWSTPYGHIWFRASGAYATGNLSLVERAIGIGVGNWGSGEAESRFALLRRHPADTEEDMSGGGPMWDQPGTRMLSYVGNATPGERYKVRMRVVENVIQVKTWHHQSQEPSSWIVVDQTGDARMPQVGAVVVFGGVTPSAQFETRSWDYFFNNIVIDDTTELASLEEQTPDTFISIGNVALFNMSAYEPEVATITHTHEEIELSTVATVSMATLAPELVEAATEVSPAPFTMRVLGRMPSSVQGNSNADLDDVTSLELNTYSPKVELDVFNAVGNVAHIEFLTHVPELLAPSAVVEPSAAAMELRGWSLGGVDISAVSAELQIDNLNPEDVFTEQNSIVSPETEALGVATFPADVFVISYIDVAPATAALQFAGHNPEILVVVGSNFRLVAADDTSYTAREAEPLEQLDFGVLLQGEDRSLPFRVGNLSSDVSRYRVKAAGGNKPLVDGVSFSTDKQNWYDSVSLIVEGNGISEVLYVRLDVPSDAPRGELTLLLNIETIQ